MVPNLDVFATETGQARLPRSLDPADNTTILLLRKAKAFLFNAGESTIKGWIRDGQIPRELYTKAPGRTGRLGFTPYQICKIIELFQHDAPKAAPPGGKPHRPRQRVPRVVTV